MSEDINTSVVKPKSIIESKLYTLARNIPLLEFMVPDLPTQMAVETEIEQTFPREEDDSDNTRILINYVNLKGNAVLYKFLDDERLDRLFDIDHFMDGFSQTIKMNKSENNDLNVINTSILSALNMAAVTTIGLNDGPDVSDKTKILAKIVLQSLTAILYNDALDIIIALNEMPLKEGQTETESMIVGIWIVKQRHLSQDDMVEFEKTSFVDVNTLN